MPERSASHSTAGGGAWTLFCARCGERFDPGPLVYGCPACAREGVISTLEAEMHPRERPPGPGMRNEGHGLIRFLDVLPGGDVSDWISLGEGGTPLLRSRVLGPELGLSHLYFKNETVNPTWSFKDRYVAVTVNVARRLGYRRVVVGSTGNLGVSVAAYCAVAGLGCLFIAPREAARPILAEARLHGAHVLVTSRARRQQLFEYVAQRDGWFPVGLFMPRAVQNPFGVEGYRTFAYEIIEALGRAPGAVLFPCARGNGLYGAWKGFLGARAWGWADALPRMVACQPVGGNSLEAALTAGLAHPPELRPVDSIAISANETISDAHALDAVRKSGGAAVSATDAEILAATQRLGLEGLCVETSSALPVACLERLLERGAIDAAEPVVCILTASGMRWPDQAQSGASSFLEVDGAGHEIDDYLAKHFP